MCLLVLGFAVANYRGWLKSWLLRLSATHQHSRVATAERPDDFEAVYEVDGAEEEEEEEELPMVDMSKYEDILVEPAEPVLQLVKEPEPEPEPEPVVVRLEPPPPPPEPETPASVVSFCARKQPAAPVTFAPRAVSFHAPAAAPAPAESSMLLLHPGAAPLHGVEMDD